MTEITMYVATWCPYCSMARDLLKSLGLEWNEINIDQEGISRSQLADLTGGFTVPQIIINGQAIGGYDQLHALNQSGKLKAMLGGQPYPPTDPS